MDSKNILKLKKSKMYFSELREDFVKETGGSFYAVSQEAIRNCPSELREDFVKETGGSFTCQ